MENQLNILSESLDQKILVLRAIQEYNKRQEAAFSAEEIDIQKFDAAVEEKGKLIEKLTRLDDGFEVMYSKLAEQLKNNRQQYSGQIQEIQQKISVVMEMSVSIQAQEKRNKSLVEAFFSKKRGDVSQNRKNAKAVYDYYKKVNNPTGMSGYWDSKQ